MRVEYPIVGRQIIAGRALAGLPTREFCKMARISPLTLNKLEAMDVIETGTAYHSPVRQVTLDKIINGRGGITPDMAIRFEKVFGSSAEAWLRMQLAYDLAQARGREKEIVASMRAAKAAV